MALKTIQAAALAVSLTMNSAQFTAAINHAAGIANQFQSKMQKAMGAVKKAANTMAKGVQAALNSVKSAFQGAQSVVDSCMSVLTSKPAMAGAALLAYTGIVTHNRLELKRLGDQFGFTYEAMNQFGFLASAVGAEAEEMADAMKELAIKAGDVVEAGAGGANTMSTFFKTTGKSAEYWQGDTNPIEKLKLLRELMLNTNEYGSSNITRVFDEMGDAGLRLRRTLELTNTEFNRLLVYGAATAAAQNMQAIDDLVQRFNFLLEVGNGFLVSVVSKLAPVITGVMNTLIDTLQEKLDGKGGVAEGFQAYSQEVADSIIEMLKTTISGLGSFIDTLRSVAHSALQALNKIPGVDTVASFDSDQLTKEDQARYKSTADKAYVDPSVQRRLDEMNNEYRDRADVWSALSQKERDANIKERRALEAKIVDADKARDRLSDLNEEFNDKYGDNFDRLKMTNASNKTNQFIDSQVREANEQRLADQLDPQNKSKKKTKTNVLAIPTDEATAKEEQAKKLLTLAQDFEEKYKAQQERIADIKKKYQQDDRNSWQKMYADELNQLQEGYRAAKIIIEDGYNKQIEAAGKNKKLVVELTAQREAKILALTKERADAENWLTDQQQKRYLIEQKRLINELNYNHKQRMRQYKDVQGGSAAVIDHIAAEREALNKSLDDELEKYEKGTLAYEEAYKRRKEVLADFEKYAAQKESAMSDGFFSSMKGMSEYLSGDTAAMSNNQAVVEGYRNQDIANAKSRADEIVGTDETANKAREEENRRAGKIQLKMTADAADQVFAEGAKRSKKMFELDKKMRIAKAIMNTYEGATKALEWGMPLGPIFAGMTIGMGMANVAMIRQQEWQGQAHDGIDFVPNEGTWNLQKGERVLSADINKDAKQAFNRINNGSSSTTTISAPLNIPAGTLIDEGGMQELLSKHVKHITKIVDQQKSDRGY